MPGAKKFSHIKYKNKIVKNNVYSTIHYYTSSILLALHDLLWSNVASSQPGYFTVSDKLLGRLHNVTYTYNIVIFIIGDYSVYFV